MKILLFDIETAPMLSNIWSLWSEVNSMVMIDRDWYMLTWSAKWLGDSASKTIVKSLPEYKNYKKDPEDDSALVKDLWDLLDEADIVIGHNAKKFDCKKVNARFILNDMLPPSPYKVIDTLTSARRHFSFSSNKLTDLGQMLGLGKKVDTGGFELWRGCMQNDSKAWKKMCKYNKQDVILLEKIYLKLRPYITNHPNTTLDDTLATCTCSACGSTDMQKRGFAYTNACKYQRVQCKKCGKWAREKKNLTDKATKAGTVGNIL